MTQTSISRERGRRRDAEPSPRRRRQGLLARMENEAPLAAVPGLEIGHVTARHLSEAITRQPEGGHAGQARPKLTDRGATP
jgi:predicted Zn-dependent protease